MNRIFVFLAASAFFLSGCMHSRTLSEQTPPDSLARINQELGNRAGHLDLQDSTRIEAQRFVFRADSTICFVKHSETPTIFPNSDIRHVVIPNRKRGVIEGLEYGALPGAIIGGALGFLIGVGTSQSRTNDRYVPPDSTAPGHWEYGHPHFMTPLEGLAMGAVIGAMPGGLLGMYMGLMGGSLLEVRYQFPVSKPR